MKNRTKGFTIGELLIVVAIVGILVGISVPLFASKKQAAIDATNKANIRAARAMAVAAFSDGTFDVDKVADTKGDIHYLMDGTDRSGFIYYRVKQGVLEYYNPNLDSASEDIRKKKKASYLENGIYQNIVVCLQEDPETSEFHLYTLPYVNDEGKVDFNVGENGRVLDKTLSYNANR